MSRRPVAKRSPFAGVCPVRLGIEAPDCRRGSRELGTRILSRRLQGPVLDLTRVGPRREVDVEVRRAEGDVLRLVLVERLGSPETIVTGAD